MLPGFWRSAVGNSRGGRECTAQKRKNNIKHEINNWPEKPLWSQVQDVHLHRGHPEMQVLPLGVGCTEGPAELLAMLPVGTHRQIPVERGSRQASSMESTQCGFKLVSPT